MRTSEIPREHELGRVLPDSRRCLPTPDVIELALSLHRDDHRHSSAACVRCPALKRDRADQGGLVERQEEGRVQATSGHLAGNVLGSLEDVAGQSGEERCQSAEGPVGAKEVERSSFL